MPQVDVLLHTEDLNNVGELDSLRDSIKMMGTIDAELRLVIAGNHDISLDKTRRVDNMSDEEYANYHTTALEIMTGPLAKEAGITYLDEGTHVFTTLTNGAKFTVYASPYTSGSGGWAFPYPPTEDRFNATQQTASDRTSLATNPIPAGIDMVMSHGPPHSILDQVDGQNRGRPHLFRALSRTKPLMHAFAHMHEGHGAHIVEWGADGSVTNPHAATPLETEQINDYPSANEWDVTRGKQALMVNAAICDHDEYVDGHEAEL